MFNGNIPQDLLDHSDHFSWYYNGSLAYNTGTLVNANGVKLVSTGRQLWDEEWERGSIDTATGQNENSNDRIRSENYIKVIPNTAYYFYRNNPSLQFIIFEYDKNKNYIGYVSFNSSKTTQALPSNCEYIRFRYQVSTYSSDITISLYYTPEQGGEGYDKYYAYKEPYQVDTGTEVLRKAGSVKDYKEPNGTIHRLVGTYTFTGSESWSALGNGNGYNATISGLGAYYGYNERTILSPVGDSKNYGNIYDGSSPNAIAISGENRIAIGNDLYTNRANLIGKTIYFALATETTEQGTPFAENLPINDYGMLYWLDENDNLVGIPQGAKIFYPTNYKGFVDDMYSRVDGDSSKYVIDEDLNASETERDTIDTQLKNAIGGTLRQCLCVKASLDFDNTAFVDLGSLSGWTYQSTYSYFYLSFANAKSPSVNVLCSKYKTVDGATLTNITGNNNVVAIRQGNLVIKDTNYTDATAFKNAMKGVLLAYEKA